jgi:hypothetical protein
MIRQYGPVFVGTYFSIYWLSWGAIFCGMDSGLIDPVQIMGYISGGGAAEEEQYKSTVHLLVEYMEKYDLLRPYAETVGKNPHIANLGVAWVANKFTEPVRLMVTIAIVPRLARHFGFVHAKQGEANESESSAQDENATDKIATDEQVPESTTEEQVPESTTKRQSSE